MSERRENSVLFSLKELRNIEEDRVKQEQQAEADRVEAARRAEEDAKRRAQEEIERRAREEQDRLAKLQQEKERQMREEQLRLEEAERRARIEAQAKLEAARIQAEIHAKAAAKKPPMGAILGAIGGVVVLAAGALIYVFMVVMPAREAEQARRAEQEREKAVAAAVQKATEQLEQEYKDKISTAKDEAEKARLLAEMKARQQAQADTIRRNTRPVAGKNTGPKPPTVKKLNCDPDKDPLCGL